MRANCLSGSNYVRGSDMSTLFPFSREPKWPAKREARATYGRNDHSITCALAGWTSE